MKDTVWLKLWGLTEFRVPARLARPLVYCVSAALVILAASVLLSVVRWW